MRIHCSRAPRQASDSPTASRVRSPWRLDSGNRCTSTELQAADETREPDETVSAGQRLRSDAELQRLRHRAERDAGYLRLRGEVRRALGHPSGAAGRRAGLPAAARPGVPPGQARGPGRGGQADPAEAQHPPPVEPARARSTATSFDFYVISAAPEEVIQLGARRASCRRSTSMAPGSGTTRHRARSSRSCGCPPATARWPCWRSCGTALGVSADRLVYVGDGSSDVHVMLHVNRHGRNDDRGVGEQVPHAHRAPHRAERRRAQRPGPDAGGHRAGSAPAGSARCSPPTASCCRSGTRSGPTRSPSATRRLPRRRLGEAHDYRMDRMGRHRHLRRARTAARIRGAPPGSGASPPACGWPTAPIISATPVVVANLLVAGMAG